SIYFLTAENSADGALTDDQKERRARVIEFEMKLGDLHGWMGEAVGPEAAFEWTAFSVLIQPGSPNGSDPSGIEPTVVEWPLADLAALGEVHPQGRRAVITGSDLATLMPLVRAANQLTVWKSGGAYYHLLLRPLLPDEVE
ncbi:MAG TPA: hypothetical protein VFD74_09815, partial [Thermoleophilia bacterium]|nr:hypothetical protein [Thermoleophilia bacterium]